MSNLLIFNQNFFWIIIFLIQVFILYLLSNSFHNKLHFLGAGITKNRLFIAKAVGYIFFIGTLVHELSHIIMARLLFVRTKNINLQTEIIDDKHIKYGTAEIEVTDPFRSTLIGIAPLIFGITLIYFLTLNINFNFFSWVDVVKLFLISQISNSMFLSDSDTKDLKVISVILVIILLPILFLNAEYSFFSFDETIISIKNFFFNSSFVLFLKNLNLIFLVTLILNLTSNIFLNLLLKIKRYWQDL